MTCTRCKHDAEIARLRAICSKCRLGEYVPGGDKVSLDAVIDGAADRILDVAPGVATVSEETQEALLRLVHEFAQLPPLVAQVTHALLNRRTIQDVAEEIGWSKQLLHYHLKKAVARFPAFAAVYRAVRNTNKKSSRDGI